MENVKTTTAVNEVKVINANGAKVVIEPKIKKETITVKYQIKQMQGKYSVTDTDEITGTSANDVISQLLCVIVKNLEIKQKVKACNGFANVKYNSGKTEIVLLTTNGKRILSTGTFTLTREMKLPNKIVALTLSILSNMVGIAGSNIKELNKLEKQIDDVIANNEKAIIANQKAFLETKAQRQIERKAKKDEQARLENMTSKQLERETKKQAKA